MRSSTTRDRIVWYGTAVMGHLDPISSQTHQAYEVSNLQKTGASTFVIRNGSVIANLDSALEDCRSAPVGGQPVASVTMTGANVGDLLNAKGITWGWFYGDFAARPGSTPDHAACSEDYDPHYDPFQYYASTANPHHLPPSSTSMIGRRGDRANHQYDLEALRASLEADSLAAVSFVNAPATDTGHPHTSDALREQKFLVDTINALQQSKARPSMAILINYVDHAVLDLTSILRFVEDNWQLGRIDSLDYPDGTPSGNPPPGQGSFDRLAGSIDGLFEFGPNAPGTQALILDDLTGEVTSPR